MRAKGTVSLCPNSAEFRESVCILLPRRVEDTDPEGVSVRSGSGQKIPINLTLYPGSKYKVFRPAEPSGSVLTVIQDLLGLLMCAVTP